MQRRATVQCSQDSRSVQTDVQCSWGAVWLCCRKDEKGFVQCRAVREVYLCAECSHKLCSHRRSCARSATVRRALQCCAKWLHSRCGCAVW